MTDVTNVSELLQVVLVLNGENLRSDNSDYESKHDLYESNASTQHTSQVANVENFTYAAINDVKNNNITRPNRKRSSKLIENNLVTLTNNTCFYIFSCTLLNEILSFNSSIFVAISSWGIFLHHPDNFTL